MLNWCVLENFLLKKKGKFREHASKNFTNHPCNVQNILIETRFELTHGDRTCYAVQSRPHFTNLFLQMLYITCLDRMNLYHFFCVNFVKFLITLL